MDGSGCAGQVHAGLLSDSLTGGRAAKDIVILSTADWSHPIWTNKQHVAQSLAALNNRVLFIDSIASRGPRLDASDAGRIWRRARRIWQRPKRVEPNISVISPTVLPFHSHAGARAINKILLNGILDYTLKQLGFESPMLVTYSPLTSQLLSLSRFDKVVYHCVDDIAAQPNMPAEFIRASERLLIDASDAIFCTSPVLADKCRAINPNTDYLPNVADFRHFSMAREDGPIPEDLRQFDGSPIILFIGAIASYKLDFELISAVAAAAPDKQFVFIGPIGEGEGGTDISALEKVPNIHFLGRKSYDELPNYMRAADVGILPSKRNDYTAAMFPMKFFEYLAAGLPVVSTRLNALDDFKDVCFLADDAASFAHFIDRALEGAGAPLNERLQAAESNTYLSRTAKMLDKIALSQNRRSMAAE